VHSDDVSALEARLQGIKEMLAFKNPTWKVLTTGMDPAIAAVKIFAALEADPSLCAVLCTGQADTEGAGLALARIRAEKRPYAAGFDLSPEILRLVKEGVIAFTIDQQPYLQGFLPVIQLALNVRYGIRPAAVDAGAAIIDRNNVESVMDLSRAGYR
jgi:simple sugar transport system substrate-binding protein